MGRPTAYGETAIHPLEITGKITGGQLHLEWTYSENVHRDTTIERLAKSFVEALRSLIAHCQTPEAGGYTPSDFPAAGLSRNTLRLPGTPRRRTTNSSIATPPTAETSWTAVRRPAGS